jgi:flagellar L-ring protein precursor FlgH
MRIVDFVLIGFLLIFGLSQAGCASFNRHLKNLLDGGSASNEAGKPSSLTKFSSSPDLPPKVQRQYRRVTKQTLAAESALDSHAGSLWVMEGQGAYLFSQNVVRLVGDPLAVNLDGDPKDQLQSKVDVIEKLLDRIAQRQKLRQRQLASEDEGDSEKSKDDKGKKGKTANKQETAANKPEEKKESGLSVNTVPTRIVERTVDGNYRVKGAQPFLIGNHEYKIIVTGIVRAEDFNDEGISATKLLDPKFDIVSARHKEGEM